MRGIPRIVIIIGCAFIVAAAGTLAAGWLTGQHAAARHAAGQHAKGKHLKDVHVTVLPKATCGSATTHFLNAGTQVLGADPGALTCFGTAARGCRAASIGVTEMGVDTGTMYVFTIEHGGTACQVTELSQYYSANFGGSTGPVSTVTCLRTAVTARGVTLTCGGQQVLIPSAVTEQPVGA